MDKIPLIKADLPSYESVKDSFQEILENGQITNFGKFVSQFEEDTAAYLGTKTIIVSSGTIGLLFTLQALGLQKGEKVAIPSATFMATAQAILYAGGIPVFVDIQDDFTMSPEDLEAVLQKDKEITAVVPVHLYGLPCQVEKIQAIVDEASAKRTKRIKILYDAAHVFGAAIGDKKVGQFGDAEVFSLSVTKALVSVEGGLVSSRDEKLIERISKMRNYGVESSYDAHWPGLNGKMSEFHAIVGIQNLKNLGNVLEKRAQRASFYKELIEKNTNFKTIPIPQGIKHTFKDIVIVGPPEMKPKRDEIMANLKAQGVETRAYFFPPVHEQTFFKQFADRSLSRTEELTRRVITLPFFTSISEEQMKFVSDALQKAERDVS